MKQGIAYVRRTVATAGLHYMSGGAAQRFHSKVCEINSPKYEWSIDSRAFFLAATKIGNGENGSLLTFFQ